MIAAMPKGRSGLSKLGNFVWGIADQLRGVYKPHQYGGVILPMTILRRLDCILEPTRDEVRTWPTKYTGGALDVKVKRKTGLGFYNTSAFDFARLLEDPDGSAGQPDGLHHRVLGEHRRLRTVQVRERDRNPGREEPAVPGDVEVRRGRPAPEQCRNAEMGDLFEELIRKFAEASNETPVSTSPRAMRSG